MSSNLVLINDKTLQIKEYQGQRVVTFKDIDTLHERPEGTAGRNFRENRLNSDETERFIKSVDYFNINQPDEIRRLGIRRPQGGTPEKIILITESGYLMLVKSLTDDLAWKVQRELVNNYFRVKYNDLNQQKKYIDIMNNTADRINDPYLKDMFLKNRLENLYGIDLPEPTRITTPAADNKYSFNRELDLVKRFLEESCIIDKNSIVPSADLYNTFISWCEINEEEPVSQTMFGRKLGEIGVHKGRKSFMRFWKGIRL